MKSTKHLPAFTKHLFATLQREIVHAWWVILFALFCFMYYEQGIKKRESDFIKLSEQLQILQEQKKEALALNQKLLLQINSESDPAWIELTLMRELGLSPKGSTKVLFLPREAKQE